MVAVSIVLGLLSVAGLLVSLLALIYPFGRFRTRGRALKAAALCVVTFVLSPMVGVIGMAAQGGLAQSEVASHHGTQPAADEAAPLTAGTFAANDETATVTAAASETSSALLAAPASPAGAAAEPAAASPIGTAAVAPSGEAEGALGTVEGASAQVEETEPPVPALADWQAKQLMMKALGGEWDVLRGEIERLRTRGVNLGPAGEELEELVLAGVEPIPASEPARNLAGYRVLAALQPDDVNYTAKVAQYEAATAAREESLLGSLRVEEDRIEGVTWYHHPHEPRYWDQRSLVWLAIGVPRGGRPQLVMHTHYTGERWLFVHEVKAYHDGYAEVLTSGEFQGDHDTEIWEWRNEVPSEHQLWILENLARAPDATLRYEGQQYHDDAELSAADKQLILDMLEAYAILSRR